MKRRLADLLPNATTLRAFHRIALGGVLASLGFSVAEPAAGATTIGAGPEQPNESLNELIVDRSRKKPKLLLRLPSTPSYLAAAHRSHRSHQSHSSHYSSRGGGSAPASPSRRPPASETPGGMPLVAAQVFEGLVMRVNAATKTIVVKESDTSILEFSYTAETTYNPLTGVRRPFLEGGRPAVNEGDRVRVSWKSDASQRVATQVVALR